MGGMCICRAFRGVADSNGINPRCRVVFWIFAAGRQGARDPPPLANGTAGGSHVALAAPPAASDSRPSYTRVPLGTVISI